MLADTEDERVVENEVGALGLSDVEVVALGVGRWMECQERVRRVVAGVSYWEADG